jgi:nucleoside-diphosphate-sugar epimerase
VVGLRRGAAEDEQLKAAGIQPFPADIAVAADLDALPLPFDWVVYCVASSRGGVEDYRRAYLEGPRNLVMRLRAAPPAKFVYLSSTGVYGQTGGETVSEASATEPAAATGQVLVEAERGLLASWRDRGLPVVILRLAGIYGPGRGYWLKQVLAGEARIEGDGSRILNMVHRDDVIGVSIAALERGRAGEVYNVVDDEPVRQAGLLGWLSARLGRPLPPCVAGDEVAARKRGVTSKRVLNRKVKEELQYAFRHPTFREGYAALGSAVE